jgi:proteic killer suppression protein
VIRSFRDADTGNVFHGVRAKRFQAIEKTAIRRLFQLHAARSLRDLRSPGCSLESLRGDRVGQHSIRINDRYRVCFVWKDGDAFEVEIVDYH